MSFWNDPRLEAAFDALDDARAETHPELGEHDKFQRAMDAIEDADLALGSLRNLYRGNSA